MYRVTLISFIRTIISREHFVLLFSCLACERCDIVGVKKLMLPNQRLCASIELLYSMDHYSRSRRNELLGNFSAKYNICMPLFVCPPCISISLYSRKRLFNLVFHKRDIFYSCYADEPSSRERSPNFLLSFVYFNADSTDIWHIHLT